MKKAPIRLYVDPSSWGNQHLAHEDEVETSENSREYVLKAAYELTNEEIDKAVENLIQVALSAGDAYPSQSVLIAFRRGLELYRSKANEKMVRAEQPSAEEPISQVEAFCRKINSEKE